MTARGDHGAEIEGGCHFTFARSLHAAERRNGVDIANHSNSLLWRAKVIEVVKGQPIRSLYLLDILLDK